MATYKEGDSATADTIMAASKNNPAMGFLMWIFGGFAMSVEVFLRRDFGERYFTRSKFMLGLLVLIVFNTGSKLMSRTPSFEDYVIDPETGNLVLNASEMAFSLNDTLMYFVLLSYIFLGSYHTFRIWWRNGTGRPLHSRDHGLTWLEPLGVLTLAVPNFFIGLVMRVYVLTLPAQERPWLMNALPFMRDARGFAERMIEPLALLLLAGLLFKLGAPSVANWLIFSTFSLLIFTIIRHEQLQNQILDMQDQQIEAKYMSRAMIGDTESLRIPYDIKKTLFDVTTVVETASPEAMEAIRRNTPNIAEAMEALNPKLKNMAVKRQISAPSPPSPPEPVDTAPPSVVTQPSPQVQEAPNEEKPTGGGGISVTDAMKNLKSKK